MKKRMFIIGIIFCIYVIAGFASASAKDIEIGNLLRKMISSVVEDQGSVIENIQPADIDFSLSGNPSRMVQATSALNVYFPLNNGDSKTYSGKVYGTTYSSTYTYNTTFFNGRSCVRESDSIDGSLVYYGYSGSQVVAYGFSFDTYTLAFNTPLVILNETILANGGTLRSSTSLTIEGYAVTINSTVTSTKSGNQTIPMGSIDDCRTIDVNFSLSIPGESAEIKDAWILAPNIGKLSIAMYDQYFNRLEEWMQLTNGAVGGKNVVDYFIKPEAIFSATPLSGIAPLPVIFTDGSQGPINSRSWDFGDGQTSVLTSPSHIYQGPGQYTVSLTVTGLNGSDTEVKTQYITVLIPPPSAQFGANHTIALPGEIIRFSDLSQGQVTSRLWNFGDGQTSTLSNPGHAYQNPGKYTVSLTVNGPGGTDTGTKSYYILIVFENLDINNDQTFDIKDPNLILDVLSGKKASSLITKIFDVSGDQKIGMEEVVYLLNRLSYNSGQ
ncbi:MAG: PKD domain-containing protein [Desulfobacula sp.]|jgi:PKD repeat protein|nr:PKD domain-containing protein [Desulfobacula sp.]